jgi:hypothetical protein
MVYEKKKATIKAIKGIRSEGVKTIRFKPIEAKYIIKKTIKICEIFRNTNCDFLLIKYSNKKNSPILVFMTNVLFGRTLNISKVISTKIIIIPKNKR